MAKTPPDEPPPEVDLFTEAPTLRRRGREVPDEADDAVPASRNAPTMPHGGERRSSRAGLLDATLVRNRGAHRDGVQDDREVSGITPEADDRYRMSGTELGRGGIGRVLVAQDRHLGRDVAIKELLPAAYTAGANDSSGDIKRFLREARITGQLEHPSIVPVYELGQRDDGSIYYAMRLVRGRTLRQAIDEAENFQDRMALLRHFVDVANAIAYAHSNGVIHRDVKPENIMLGEFGETVVLDWGLAKVRDQSDPMGTTLKREIRGLKGTNTPATVVGDVVGTPAYMSPEQANGHTDRVNERSDVWSLGAVLYEILTGKAPFRATNVEILLFQIIREDIQSVRAVVPEAPADLAAIAEKALRKPPEERYVNARALVEDVIAFQNGRQVDAYDYSAWDLIKKFARENRAAALAAILITITLVLGGIAVVASYRNAVFERGQTEIAKVAEEKARKLAEANERKAAGNLSVALAEKARLLTRNLDFGAAGVYAASAIFHSPFFESSPFRHPDLDELDPVDIAREQLGPRSALYEVMARRQLVLTATLPTDESSACAFDIFADGERLLATDTQGRYVVWDLIRRQPIRTLNGPGCPRRIDVEPQGQWALVVTRDRSGILLNLKNDAATKVELPNESSLRALLFAEDEDSFFAVGSRKTVARIRTNDLKMLAATKVIKPRAAAFDPDSGRSPSVPVRVRCSSSMPRRWRRPAASIASIASTASTAPRCRTPSAIRCGPSRSARRTLPRRGRLRGLCDRLRFSEAGASSPTPRRQAHLYPGLHP